MTTVLLCSRNGELYIRQQMDSILRQAPGILLHVFDDCSGDGTRAILKEYLAAYPGRVKLTLRETPTGSATANFLMAIREAEDCDYYMLSDQDDVWHPDKYTTLLTAIRAFESEDGNDCPLLVHSDAAVIDDRMNRICPSFVKFADLSPQIRDFNHLLLQNQVTGGACIFNKAFKKLIENAELPVKAAVHDHWMAIVAAAFGKICYVDKALYDYRQHQSNAIGAKKAGFVSETKRRLGLGEESKAEIDEITRREFQRVYDQAAEFKRIYGAKLDAEKAEALNAFISLPDVNKATRWLIITKYGFHFNNIYRFVGEYIFI